MLHSNRFTAILDACVLYPAPLRDLLLSLAQSNLFKPKWTECIQEEWVSNLLEERPELSPDRILRTVNLMNEGFEDSLVLNYEEIIPSLNLPDPNDNHVLAAAIRCNADVIVTANLKDFPSDYLSSYDIEVQSPDQFIYHLIELDNRAALEALVAQSQRLKNPPQSLTDILATLENNGLTESVKLFRTLI
ncbi:MAG: PIN domain-containing protein [Saprospiraceae bacterium]